MTARAALPLLGVALVAGLVAATVAIAETPHRKPRTNFILRCVGCHGMDGAGSEKGGIPDFRNYVGAFSRDEAGRTYVMHVPGVVNASLTNAEIAEVMNYVMTTFGGPSLPDDYRPLDEAEVDRLRAVPVEDIVALRRDLSASLAKQGIATAGYPWP
ncbi:cytochrome c [Pleomorphomonas sp. JP5]|uniref:c-type cytochrome n=1 Tax=Pleomorphomonas sp. JP5 TaxID=2942998 RepID=UPI002042EC54|nr:cytochrome c [Pleomorphomonas sp. JP5]MCM5557218.1 cytochrome c [Pleomorphomonas sp. JP5]